MLKTAHVDIVGARFMRRPAVEHMTGLSRSTIYDFVSQGRFPKPVQISPRVVGWIEEEVLAWMHERISARESEAA
jgi:prophage regulatory protein